LFDYDAKVKSPLLASRHAKATYDDYWSHDDPLASYNRQPASYSGFKEFYVSNEITLTNSK